MKYILKLQENGISSYRIRKILEMLRTYFPDPKEPRLLFTSVSLKSKKFFKELDGVMYDVDDRQGLLFPLDPDEAKILEFIPAKPTRERQLLHEKEAFGGMINK